jgi:hypothetical protein
MIFVVVGLAWLVSALVAGSLLGRCVADADRRTIDAEAAAPHKQLYVADILRAYAAADQPDVDRSRRLVLPAALERR